MRLLLDTHVLLWWATDSDRLDVEIKRVIDEEEHEAFLSAVSSAEMAIKAALGKLDIPPGLIGTHPGPGFQELPLTSRHAAALAVLPPLHHDPFDRMLVAQAQTEGMVLVTVDPRCRAYDVPVLPTR